MKNTKYLKLGFTAFILSRFIVSISIESLDIGRTGNIDYQAFYTGTQSFETDCLILRQITLDDAEDMFAFTSDPEIETWDPVDKTIDDTKAFIKFLQKKYAAKEPTFWGIEHKQDKKLIGYCGFASNDPKRSIVELEYALTKRYWNQGLMSEALIKILSFTFNVLKINRVIAFALVNNKNSINVLQKMGMQVEGFHREVGYNDGKFWNMKSFALLREDFLAR